MLNYCDIILLEKFCGRANDPASCAWNSCGGVTPGDCGWDYGREQCVERWQGNPNLYLWLDICIRHE